jgi:hypothetical protein
VVRCVVPPWRSWWDLLHDNVEIERECLFHGKTPHGFIAKNQDAIIAMRSEHIFPEFRFTPEEIFEISQNMHATSQSPRVP